jgi:hypothetical protein
VIEAAVGSLRRKLGGEAHRLETVRGVGYRLRPGCSSSARASCEQNRPPTVTPGPQRHLLRSARPIEHNRSSHGSRPTTGWPTWPPPPSPGSSPGSPACAGRSSWTTNSSRANSASTTTRAAHTSAGTTTLPWSPPRTASSPWSAFTQKPRGRPDTPENRPAPATDLQVLDRPLHHLPAANQPQPDPITPHQTRRVTLNKALLGCLMSEEEPTSRLPQPDAGTCGYVWPTPPVLARQDSPSALRAVATLAAPGAGRGMARLAQR